jgi:hypothetical protein
MVDVLLLEVAVVVHVVLVQYLHLLALNQYQVQQLLVLVEQEKMYLVLFQLV